jgi:hypothetical protein
LQTTYAVPAEQFYLEQRNHSVAVPSLKASIYSSAKPSEMKGEVAMSAHFHVPEREDVSWVVFDLSHLPTDFRRMLSVQFREFIHQLEDRQSKNDLSMSPGMVNFLERCLEEAV